MRQRRSASAYGVIFFADGAANNGTADRRTLALGGSRASTARNRATEHGPRTARAVNGSVASTKTTTIERVVESAAAAAHRLTDWSSVRLPGLFARQLPPTAHSRRRVTYRGSL